MFSYKDISQYHNDLQSGTFSCADAVQFYLDQVVANEKLNAFTELYAAEALATARSLDEKRRNGTPIKKLHGVVIAIKDVICYQGHRVSAASKILDGFVSLYSATAVQRLLDEDAIIIGSCNCDEFAMGSSNENSVYGPVLNAVDNNRVPGGSSGGSAVAVQADMCMLSLGSDTGGSVRQPADFCGILGLKPSYGTISRYGLIAYASSFDQIGIFGKNVADIALLLEIMSGPDNYDSTASPSNKLFSSTGSSEEGSPNPNVNLAPPAGDSGKYRIAYFKEALHHPSLDVEIKEQIISLINTLREAGHTVSEIDFSLLDYVVPAYYVLTTAEASSNLNRYDGIRFGYQTRHAVEDLTEFYKRNRTEAFGKEVQRRIMLGTFVLSSGYYDAYYSKAQQVRRLLQDQTSSIFIDYDAIISPTSPTTAFPLGEKTNDPVSAYLADIFTVFANLTGVPGISVPLFTHSNGMPFGLQIMTKNSDELTLLKIADHLLKQKQSF